MEGDLFKYKVVITVITISVYQYVDDSVVKNPLAGDTGDAGLIPGSGRSPRVANNNPLRCSCLENHMDRGAWWAAVHGVAKNWKRLSMHAHTPSYFESTALSGVHSSHWNYFFLMPQVGCVVFPFG